jgi:hypothetical protein
MNPPQVYKISYTTPEATVPNGWVVIRNEVAVIFADFDTGARVVPLDEPLLVSLLKRRQPPERGSNTWVEKVL